MLVQWLTVNHWWPWQEGETCWPVFISRSSRGNFMRQPLLLCVSPHPCPVGLFTAGSCLAFMLFPLQCVFQSVSCRVFRVVFTTCQSRLVQFHMSKYKIMNSSLDQMLILQRTHSPCLSLNVFKKKYAFRVKVNLNQISLLKTFSGFFTSSDISLFG